jgi:transposase
LDSGRNDKNDAHDARSAAIVALRHRNSRAVALEDDRQVLRLLARRHHQLTAALVELHGRIEDAVKAARTLVTDVFGVGPIVACYLIGYSEDIRRFPTAGHYARYNATAPIEASTGPKKRHRLNPNGNRQLNHAIHIAALGQISHDTPGRAYYLAKQAAGKSRKEAMRCVKRRISDAVYRQLRADLTR